MPTAGKRLKLVFFCGKSTCFRRQHSLFTIGTACRLYTDFIHSELVSVNAEYAFGFGLVWYSSRHSRTEKKQLGEKQEGVAK